MRPEIRRYEDMFKSASKPAQSLLELYLLDGWTQAYEQVFNDLEEILKNPSDIVNEVKKLCDWSKKEVVNSLKKQDQVLRNISNRKVN